MSLRVAAFVALLYGCGSSASEPSTSAPEPAAPEPAAPEPATPQPRETAESAPVETEDPFPLSPAVVEITIEHPSHPTPPGAPHASLSIGEGVVGPSVPLVMFLHGWSGCSRVLFGTGRLSCRDGEGTHFGWGLSDKHALSQHPSVFIVPQLTYRDRSGLAGRFVEEGFYQQWIMEVLGQLQQSQRIDAPLQAGRTIIVAHSAGYETTLAMLDDVQELSAVVLFDALYAGAARFAQWAAEGEGRRLISAYTGRRTTHRQNQALARHCRDLLGNRAVALDPDEPMAAVDDHRVVIYESAFPHGAIPARELSSVLEALR